MLERLVSRAKTLYTLPAVAAKVITLTDSPTVDVRALKECIQNDPALTVKLLRVVNSSLFGLSREVGDLNEAIALLGIKPLKLLVLGFCLPEALFREVGREQLQWYWSTTLCRAVAAREISEQVCQRPGDDAFLAGLLEDIGILVLLGQVKEPYGKLLTQVIEEGQSLGRLEIETLGFDHTTLSARMLDAWNLPRLLVETISRPRNCSQLKKSDASYAELARILHTAEMLAELVGNNRIAVLPNLLEALEAYYEVDRDGLKRIVVELQPKVEQLADVLSLQLADGTDYVDVLAEAHHQMSLLAEEVSQPLSQGAAQWGPSAELAEKKEELRTAVNSLAEQPVPTGIATKTAAHEVADPASGPIATADEAPVPNQLAFGNSFLERLTLAVGGCRSMREPLSLLIVEVRVLGRSSDQSEAAIDQLLGRVCRQPDWESTAVEPLGPLRRAMILPNQERLDAARTATALVEQIHETLARLSKETKAIASAGVASVSLPPKNFLPQSLLETATRCLTAASRSEVSAVKSLEIY